MSSLPSWQSHVIFIQHQETKGNYQSFLFFSHSLKFIPFPSPALWFRLLHGGWWFLLWFWYVNISVHFEKLVTVQCFVAIFIEHTNDHVRHILYSRVILEYVFQKSLPWKSHVELRDKKDNRYACLDYKEKNAPMLAKGNSIYTLPDIYYNMHLNTHWFKLCNWVVILFKRVHRKGPTSSRSIYLSVFQSMDQNSLNLCLSSANTWSATIAS